MCAVVGVEGPKMKETVEGTGRRLAWRRRRLGAAEVRGLPQLTALESSRGRHWPMRLWPGRKPVALTPTPAAGP